MSRNVSIASKNRELGWKQGKGDEVTGVERDEGSWEQVAGVKSMGPAQTRWMCGRCIKLPADGELPVPAKWVCAGKSTETGLLGTSKALLPPYHFESRAEKTRVDKKDPFVELEVEGICETTADWGYQDAFRTVSN